MPLFILLACAIYPILKIRWAHNRVESFCAQVTIGMSVHGLEAKAKKLGLKVSRFKANGSRLTKLTAWEGWTFARWFCVVDHTDGKVVSKETYFLD